ncbi:MAG: Cache 3/Cache 2 fusion domain-containing protein [Pyrinomonadaceae bacterium]|nr:Cache 3/Cache 2 fusion domain-containing protein [Pyrinomonadaceae bacterium]
MARKKKQTRLATKLALPITVIIAVVSITIGLIIAQMMLTRIKKEAEQERGLKVVAMSNDLLLTRSLMLERVKDGMSSLLNSTKSENLKLGAPVNLSNEMVNDLRLDNVSLVGESRLINQLSKSTGAESGIMVRSGDDFVMIATNSTRPDGTNATGEKLERTSKAYELLLNGKSDYGSGFVGTTATGFKPVVRGFEPLRDVNNNVVGAWYVAYPIESLSNLAKQVSNETILSDGFLALVDNRQNIIFKSNTASDDLLKQIIDPKAASSSRGGRTIIAQIAEQNNKQSPADWNIQQTNVPEWDYKIISGYSNSDAKITGELFQIRLWTILIALGVSLLIGGIAVWIASRITFQLIEAVEVAEKIAEGDLSSTIAVTSTDEVGQLQFSMSKLLDYLQNTANVADKIAAGDLSIKVPARSENDRFGTALENMLENLLKLVQSKDERDRLQTSIMKLLEEVAEVADGDLTTQAEVTPEVTGAIADAFNYMIVELRNIIYQVKDATRLVGSSAGDIRTTTERLASGSATQARQIAITSNAIEEMAHSIQQVSMSAAQSSEVAQTSLQTAQNGAKAMQNNIRAMSRIRTQVQETAKRIKRLGERSQEIGEIVQLIDDIADRTSILALNASLQAAAAGEAGRGFVVVAEEVERLAERSTLATQQIAALTKTIQLETKDVVASMEDTIQEVVEGSSLANEAGQALQEIERVSNNLAEIIQSITNAARRQARGSEGLTKSMNDISQITDIVSLETKQAANSVKDLVSLTEKLRGSVATFKLPEAENNGNGHNGNGHKSNGHNGNGYHLN